MTEGFKNAKSFLPYYSNNKDCYSVDVSVDPLRIFKPLIKVQTSFEKIFQHQSTDQPCSPNIDQIQNSYEAPEMVYLMNSQQKCPYNNNSLDSKMWSSRPLDIIGSQNRVPVNNSTIQQSPKESQIQYEQNEPQIKFNQKQEKKYFQKEQLKFFKEESAESEAVINYEESSIESIPKKKKNKKGRKYKNISDSSESFRISRKKKQSKVNDTKNITKNYSKAIISYILNNQQLVQSLMHTHRYEDLVNFLKNKKNAMTNIKQLRDLWIDGGKNTEYNRIFRIISQYFLKNQAISYIYNSRISNTLWHLKYRYNLLRALKEPENFKFIKEI